MTSNRISGRILVSGLTNGLILRGFRATVVWKLAQFPRYIGADGLDFLCRSGIHLEDSEDSMMGWTVVFIQRIKIGLAGVVLAGMSVMAAQPARAEMQFSTYMGYGYNLESDFDIKQPDLGNGGPTDLTLHDVSSEDYKSLTWDGGPMYYGLRLSYWLPSSPNWGFAVDYTHLKVAPDLNDTVRVTGTRDGAAVNANEPLNQTVDKLEYTDGLNLLTFNALYRFAPEATWNPYVGAGVGLSIPHVEFSRNNSAVQTFDYQLAGVAVQMLAGIEYRFWANMAAFAEYKLTYAEVDGDLDDGGSLESEHWTNHFIVGLTYRFGNNGYGALK